MPTQVFCVLVEYRLYSNVTGYFILGNFDIADTGHSCKVTIHFA